MGVLTTSYRQHNLCDLRCSPAPATPRGHFSYLYLIIKELTFPWFGPSIYAFVQPCLRLRPSFVGLFESFCTSRVLFFYRRPIGARNRVYCFPTADRSVPEKRKKTTYESHLHVAHDWPGPRDLSFLLPSHKQCIIFQKSL
jgi:hypothetical protein